MDSDLVGQLLLTHWPYAESSEVSKETATNPVFNLLLSVRKRRLRYHGHVLRMSNDCLVKKSLLAYTHGGENVPEGSLLMDCGNLSLHELELAAQDRKKWRQMIDNLQ